MVAGSAPGDDLVRRAIPVMGTVVSVHARPGAAAGLSGNLALAAARACLHKADATFSTWKAESPMSLIRRGEMTVEEAPPEVAEVLTLCFEARDLSGGWFDPWAAPGGLDPTGLVKGWAAAQALARLQTAGVEAAMVSAGGDVAMYGRPRSGRPWRIGVQNPFDPGSVVAVVEPPGAIATSGTYQRGPHIFDPFTGRAASPVASATVTGADLALADALATAIVAGGDEAISRVEAIPGYEALVIDHDGTVRPTVGFPFAREDPASVAPAGPGS